ncbi:TetR family transcriptional regulator [Frigoribacterium sp. CG_9.8]|uniref:TetR/AcrR family transcriptional regulator n=1 Tax=Frigoribacterium sp. CG_9.8 TaxID=2787733 RepID=UPI0018C9D846|nr:DNA-binding transcriptional regulator YbjK [Frigoribacterium sp. CG_9.8]
MVATTAKGEARRTELQDAVIRVLESGGLGAVTHRAVAAEARVPLAAATYYFASIDDLLVSALLRVTEQQVALFAHLDCRSLTDTAIVLHGWVYGSRASAIAQYELLFLAMRRDSLREAADLWYRSLEGAIAPIVPSGRYARVAALAIDGLILRMLWRGEPASVGEVTAALRDILRSVHRSNSA